MYLVVKFYIGRGIVVLKGLDVFKVLNDLMYVCLSDWSNYYQIFNCFL